MTSPLRWLRRRPHFLGIGTQKGGTTSLYRLLRQHPQLFLPEPKELQYFSLHYAEGPDWYTRHFQAARRGQRCGEITPYYLFHPEAPQRIHRLRRSMRLLVLLRDPVARTLSQYFHACRHGFESLDLEAALAAEPDRLAGSEAVLRQADGVHQAHQRHSYLARSRYEQQISRYWRLFRRRQLLILRSEDLFTAPHETRERIRHFLGIEPFPEHTQLARSNASAGEARQVAPALKARLREELAPTYTWLERELGMRWP